MSKFKNILIIILLGVAVVFSYNNKMYKNNYARASQDLSQANKAFEINEAQLKTLENENEGLKNKLKDFKNVESVTKVITKTIIDTVHVAYDSIINISDSGTFIGNINIDSAFYKFSCTFTEKNFTLNSLEIPNEASIVIGDKKIRGMFGIPRGKEYSIDIVNTNPHVQTINIQTYKIVNEKRWYETRGFAIGVGFVGGFMLAK